MYIISIKGEKKQIKNKEWKKNVRLFTVCKILLSDMVTTVLFMAFFKK